MYPTSTSKQSKTVHNHSQRENAEWIAKSCPNEKLEAMEVQANIFVDDNPQARDRSSWGWEENTKERPKDMIKN